MNSYLAKSAIVAALGGLLFGFDTAVIAGTTGALTTQYHLTPAMLGVTVPAALWGTILGAMFGGIPGDRYGRRASLRITAVLYLISALGCAFAFDWNSSRAGALHRRARDRRVVGARAHVYRGDRAGGKARPAGRLLPVQHRVRHPAGVLLELRGRHDGLRRRGVALEARRCGGPGGAVLRSAVHDSGEPALAGAQGPHAGSRGGPAAHRRPELSSRTWRRSRRPWTRATARPSEPLFQRKYRFPIFLAVSIGMFNQLSGINAMLYYLNDIFEKAGFTKVSSDLQAVAVGATNLLFTMLAMSVIDRLGRKKLLLIGSVGTAVALAGVAAIFLSGKRIRICWSGASSALSRFSRSRRAR